MLVATAVDLVIQKLLTHTIQFYTKSARAIHLLLHQPFPE